MTKSIALQLIVLILYPLHVSSQTLWMQDSWPSYTELDKMYCHELAREWTFIRKDMTILLKPENLEKNTLWNQANGIFSYIIALQKEKNCNSYSPHQMEIPLPEEYYSFSDAQLVACSTKCLKGMARIKEGIQILRIGANANYVDCQYNLGMMLYATGDKHNGKKWLRSASYLGSSDAEKALKSIEKTESNQ